MKLPRNQQTTKTPLKYGRPTRSLASLLDSVTDADQRDRLAEAVRMDNCGMWFLCRSHWTVAQLERRFAEELVGTVLYERVGGMLQGEDRYVYLQISLMKSVLQKMHPDSEPEWLEVPLEKEWPDASVTTALKELQVKVLSIVPDIREVIETGRY